MGKPAEKKPEEKKPAEKKPEEKKPADKKPEEKKPAEKKPEEKKPDEAKPKDAIDNIVVTIKAAYLKKPNAIGSIKIDYETPDGKKLQFNISVRKLKNKSDDAINVTIREDIESQLIAAGIDITALLIDEITETTAEKKPEAKKPAEKKPEEKKPAEKKPEEKKPA